MTEHCHCTRLVCVPPGQAEAEDAHVHHLNYINAMWRGLMKAMVNTHYGSPDVLQLTEVATPTPTDDEVLVKVQAVSVNRSDWEGLSGKPLYARIGGLLKP